MAKRVCLSFLMLLAPAMSQTYTIETIAGTSAVGDNGPATAALLAQAEGIAIDGVGNVYVADAGDNRVRKISPSGIITTIAGNGFAGFSGDGGPAIAAQLNHPYGIALDVVGNVYVADLGNACVRRVDTTGIITTIAGGGSTPVSATSGVVATTAKLTSPRNVAVDIGGNVYISDFDAQQVYQLSPSGLLTVLAGTGAAGFSGDGGGATLAQISYPGGLATDANGNVYIAESGNGNIRRVWRGAIATVATGITAPTGVALDVAGRVYVASSSATTGMHAPSTAGLTVELVAAMDVASNPAGVLFLAAPHTIQKLAGSSLTTIAGTANFAAYGDGGAAAAARLGGPVAIARDASGNLYIAEQGADRIRKVASNGQISILIGDSSQIGSPSGIAADAFGNVYFSDTANNRVARVSAGVVSTVIGNLKGPSCIRTAADGSLFICETANDRVLKVTPSGALLVAANVTKPAGLAVANDGSFYVSSGQQVLQISASGASTVVAAALSSPAGLAINSSYELLIAEAGKNRVIKLGAAGLVTVLAGTGQAGFGGDGGAASTALLNGPADLLVDPAGNILVADSGNNRVRQLSASAGVAAALTASPITVVNAASLLPGAVAPNEIVTIYGAGFDPATAQVLFDNIPATIFYAGSSQINALVPSTIAPGGTTTLSIASPGAPAAAATLNAAASAPAIFTAANGTGQAAALDHDGTANSDNNPESRGGILVLYLTGDGGRGIAVQIAGVPATVLYAGPAPGYSGLTQVNVQAPAGFLPGGDLPIVVTAGSASTQAGVTVAIH